MPPGAACALGVAGDAAPILIRLGDDVTVRTRLKPSCREQVRPYHLAIAVDAAAVAEDEPGDWVPSALAELATRLDLAENPEARVGVVSFDAHARLLCAPTADPAALDRCLATVRDPRRPPEGSGGLAAAIDAAAKTLLLARGGRVPGVTVDPLREAMLVLTAAGDAPAATAAYCAGTARAAALARDEGIALGMLCLAGDCASPCLAGAVAPARLEPAGDWPRLAEHYSRQVWSTRTRIRQVTLHESFPAQVSINAASFDPPGAVYDPEAHRLQWDLDVTGIGDLRLSYSARPTLPGTWPIRLAGQAIFVDTWGETGIVNLPSPKVAVVDGEPARVHLPLGLRETPALWQPFFGPGAR
jgi:hypothetical protein